MKPLNKDAAGTAYCGPTAICVITGKPLSKVREVIRDLRGDQPGRKRPVRGMFNKLVLRALIRFGYSIRRVEGDLVEMKPTLARFLRSRPRDLMNCHLLIEVTGHYVTVKGRKFVDTFTDGKPVFISKAPGRRKRVKTVWRVEKITS